MAINTESTDNETAGLDAELLAINEKLVISAIRQQEHAEVALRAEQRLRDLVHGLDAVICEVDVRTWRPVFLSLRTATFLGHPVDHWQEQADFLTQIIHPDDRDRVAALFPTFEQLGQGYEYEFRALSISSDEIWMRNIMRRVQDAAGNVELLRCIIIDVTAQRQVAEALEAAFARERNIADTLQRSLLFMPPEDSFPGLAVKTLHESASDEALVGGDFWDTFACDHGNVALIVGDVMGHGLPAAVFTAELKYTLRGFVREHVNPGRILTQMNACLSESFRLYREGLNDEGDDAPVCLTVAIIDTATGAGAVSVAGMGPPLLLRDNGILELMTVNGLPLGITQEQEYTEVPFQLDQGDFLIMVTDGVTESRQGSLFLAEEGLMGLVQEGRSLETLEKMGQAILDGTKAFAGGKLKDDACVLLVRRQ